MKSIKNLFSLLTLYKKELLVLKILVLIMINIWLMIIFWKVIALDGLKITNNNIAITTMETILKPVLMYLGLDILSPNTIKMMIITGVIVLSNLAVLYFNQMMAFVLLGITARYSYKAYNNYVNKETLNYYGFEKIAELTMQEKNEILKEFIKEKGIQDESLIGYLSNKMGEMQCINKNELILSINNNFLEYKQEILSKIILHQKEQMDKIEIINQKGSWWESIDINTMVKIGVAVIIVGGLIWLGYSYYNNNAVTAAEDIGKKALEGAEKSSNIALEHANESAKELLENTIKTTTQLHKKVIETKKQFREELTELAENVNQLNIVVKDKEEEFIKFSEEINIKTQEFIKKGTEIQEECGQISQKVLSENEKTVDTIIEALKIVRKLKKDVKKFQKIEDYNTSMVTNINNIVLGQDTQDPETPSLVTKVENLNKEISEIDKAVNGNSTAITAILKLLGVDVELSEIGVQIFNAIKAARRGENEYQRVLQTEDLSDYTPVDNSTVTDTMQDNDEC